MRAGQQWGFGQVLLWGVPRTAKARSERAAERRRREGLAAMTDRMPLTVTCESPSFAGLCWSSRDKDSVRVRKDGQMLNWCPLQPQKINNVIAVAPFHDSLMVLPSRVCIVLLVCCVWGAAAQEPLLTIGEAFPSYEGLTKRTAAISQVQNRVFLTCASFP